MALTNAHSLARAIMALGDDFHLHIHSSGVDVTVPAGTHMDDANDLAFQVVDFVGTVHKSGPVKGAVIEGGWQVGTPHTNGRFIRHPRTVKKLDTIDHSAMLRFPDGGVAFVRVTSYQQHEHGPFIQSSRDQVWRCERCGKRALVRELKAAGVA